MRARINRRDIEKFFEDVFDSLAVRTWEYCKENDCMDEPHFRMSHHTNCGSSPPYVIVECVGGGEGWWWPRDGHSRYTAREMMAFLEGMNRVSLLTEPHPALKPDTYF